MIGQRATPELRRPPVALAEARMRQEVKKLVRDVFVHHVFKDLPQALTDGLLTHPSFRQGDRRPSKLWRGALAYHIADPLFAPGAPGISSVVAAQRSDPTMVPKKPRSDRQSEFPKSAIGGGTEFVFITFQLCEGGCVPRHRAGPDPPAAFTPSE